MDLFRFIDSKDIREHLRQIGYPFTASEAAFLVWQCRSATLKEKMAAWREIIETMPDCCMEERINMDAMPSIHKFLEQYMAMIGKLLEKFFWKNFIVRSMPFILTVVPTGEPNWREQKRRRRALS